MGDNYSKFKRSYPEKPKTDDGYKACMGDYGIVKTISSGPGYKVKLAYHKDQNDPVAVKIMVDITPEQIQEIT